MKDSWQSLGKKPLIVASLGGGERLVDSARRATKLGADLIEIRVDTLETKERANVASILSAVKESTDLPLIVTVRSAAEQGPGSQSAALDDRERKILFEDSLSAADAFDVEIESDSLAQNFLSNARQAGKKIILSYHDFGGIPSAEKLVRLTKSFETLGGDILKIAAMAKGIEDVLKIFEISTNLNKINRSLIAMGECGRISRVAGFVHGSCLTYGYMNKPTAPGQLAVQELTQLCSLFYPECRSSSNGKGN